MLADDNFTGLVKSRLETIAIRLEVIASSSKDATSRNTLVVQDEIQAMAIMSSGAATRPDGREKEAMQWHDRSSSIPQPQNGQSLDALGNIFKGSKAGLRPL